VVWAGLLHALLCACVCVFWLAFVGLVVWWLGSNYRGILGRGSTGTGEAQDKNYGGRRGLGEAMAFWGLGLDGEAQSVCMYLCLFILTAVDDIRAAL
jgi:hypothetical protein